MYDVLKYYSSSYPLCFHVRRERDSQGETEKPIRLCYDVAGRDGQTDEENGSFSHCFLFQEGADKRLSESKVPLLSKVYRNPKDTPDYLYSLVPGINCQLSQF